MNDAAAFRALTQDLFDISSLGIRPGLERTSRLLHVLGDPQRAFRAIHVLGTNGKGSTAATIESILERAGMRTAFCSSPHLVSLGERLRVSKRPLPIAVWRDAFERVRAAVEADSALDASRPTFFEHLTAMIFVMTAEAGVDAAVYEAGMGGRYDATSTCERIATVITSISIDHTEYLGTSIDAIASEKFAAARMGMDAFYRPDDQRLGALFRDTCERAGAIHHMLGASSMPSGVSISLDGTEFDLFDMRALHTPLIGQHQAVNAALAISAMRELCAAGKLPANVADEAVIREGLSATSWPGRCEVVRDADGAPRMILDGAHNASGMNTLISTLQELGEQGVRAGAAVFAMMADKDVDAVLDELARLRIPVVFTQPSTPRAMACEDLEAAARAKGITSAGSRRHVREALALAHHVAGDDIAVCCGSLYLIGEIKETMLDADRR